MKFNFDKTFSINEIQFLRIQKAFTNTVISKRPYLTDSTAKLNASWIICHNFTSELQFVENSGGYVRAMSICRINGNILRASGELIWKILSQYKENYSFFLLWKICVSTSEMFSCCLRSIRNLSKLRYTGIRLILYLGMFLRCDLSFFQNQCRQYFWREFSVISFFLWNFLLPIFYSQFCIICLSSERK